MHRSLSIAALAALIPACTKEPSLPASDAGALSQVAAPSADGPRSTQNAHQIGEDDGTKLCVTVEEPRGRRTWVADIDALFRATQEGNESWNALLLASGREALPGVDAAAAFSSGFNALLGLVKESGQLETGSGPCASAPTAVVPTLKAAATLAEDATATASPANAPSSTTATPALADEFPCREVLLANPHSEAREVWIKYADATGSLRSLKVRAEAGASGVRLGWHSYESWTCANNTATCAKHSGFQTLCAVKLEVASRPWATWVGGWSAVESLEGKVPYQAAAPETLEISLK